MEKEILKCDKCKVSPVPAYRIKYCDACANQIKRDFAGDLPKPGTLINEETTTETKGNGFHLTPEQCRSNALASAIACHGNIEHTDGVIGWAKIFEKYIVTGE